MFETGTRVILLASGFRGGLGPKRGSLGFFQGRTTDDIALDIEEGLVGFRAKVVFYRYGFEQRERSEARELLCLLPIINEQYGDISGQVEKLSRRIQTGKEDAWNRIRAELDASGSEITAMVGPAIPTSLIGTSQSVLNSWVVSMVNGPFMYNGLMPLALENHLINSRHPSISPADVAFLNELYSSKPFKDSIVESAAKNKDECRRLILTLQLAKMIFSRSRLKKGRSSLNMTSVSLTDDVFLQWYREYCIQMFQPAISEIIERKFRGREPERYIRILELVKHNILLLSARLEAAGQIDGKKASAV